MRVSSPLRVTALQGGVGGWGGGQFSLHRHAGQDARDESAATQANCSGRAKVPQKRIDMSSRSPRAGTGAAGDLGRGSSFVQTVQYVELASPASAAFSYQGPIAGCLCCLSRRVQVMMLPGVQLVASRASHEPHRERHEGLQG